MNIIFKIMCGFLSYSAMNTIVFAIDCKSETQLSAVLKKANFSYISSDLVDCKILSSALDTQLIAYAQWRSEPHEPEVGDYVLSFISYDLQQHKINDIYQVKQPLISDAITLESIQLYTAAYQLQPNLRAIGLRLNYHGHSQPNPFSMQLLDLYDLKNKRKILDSLIVRLYRAETDTHCNADIEERKSNLIMQKIQTNNVMNIQVNSKIEKYQMYGNQEHCKEVQRKLSQQKNDPKV